MHLQLLTKDERSDNEEEEDEDLTEDKDVKVTNGRHHWRLLSWRLPEETVEDFEVHEALTPTLGC